MRDSNLELGVQVWGEGVMPLGRAPRAVWGLELPGHTARIHHWAAHLLPAAGSVQLLPLHFKPEPFETRVLLVT